MHKMQSPLKFQQGDLVFAKCRDSPYWPAKIILLLSEHRIYKVSFFNHNSTAYIDQNDILLFTKDTIKAQKKSLLNKMRQNKLQNRTRNIIFKGIEIAEKEIIPHLQLIKQQNQSLKEEKVHKEEVEQSESKKSSKEKQLTIELSFQAMNKRKRSPTHFIDPNPSKKQKISEVQPPVHHTHQILNTQQQEQNYNMQHIQYQIQKKFSRLKKKEKELKRLQKKNRQDMQYLRKSSSQHIDSQIHELEFKQHEENENQTLNPGKQESLVILEMMPLHQSVQKQAAEEFKEIHSVHLQQRPKLQQKSQEVLLEEISQQSEVLIPVFIEPRVEVLVDIKEESPHEIARVEEIIRYKQESSQEVAVKAKTEIADGSCEEIPRPERQPAPIYDYQIKQPFQQLPAIEEKEQSQQYIKKEAVNHADVVYKHQDIPVSKIQQEVLIEYDQNRRPDQENEEEHVQLKRQSVQEAEQLESENQAAASIHELMNQEIVQSHYQPESLIAHFGSNVSNQPQNEQVDNEEAQSQSEKSIQLQGQADSQGKNSFYQQIDELIPIARMKEQQQSQESQEEERELNFISRQFSQGEDQAAVNSNAPATIDKQMDIQSNEQEDFQQEHQQGQKQECESFQNPLFQVIHKKLERQMDTSGLEEMFDQAFGIPADYMVIMGNLQKTHQKLQQLPRSLLVQTLRKYTLQIVHYLDGKCDLRQNLMTMTQRQLFLALITLDNLNISELYEIGIIDELTYLINLFETSPKKTRSGKYHAEYLMAKARMNYYTFQLGNPIKNVESQNWMPKIRGEA